MDTIDSTALSSVGAALRGIPKRPNSILLYVLFPLGLYLAIGSLHPDPSIQHAAILNLPFGFVSKDVARSVPHLRLLGILLSVISAMLFMAHRYHLAKAFRDLANPENCPDLMNIGEHYGIISVPDEKEGMKGPEKQIASASGF
jgi:hypothetical protein